ncbi:MAG: hypothetical protein ACKO34_02730 [Vampirovibrionales bacterium]
MMQSLVLPHALASLSPQEQQEKLKSKRQASEGATFAEPRAESENPPVATTTTEPLATASTVSPTESTPFKLWGLTPAQFGMASVPVALGAVYLPSVLNAVTGNTLSNTDKTKIHALASLTPDTPEAYAKKVAHATAVLNRFTTEGDDWLRNHPATKFYINHYFFNPATNSLDKANPGKAFESLKKQIAFNALYLKYGRDLHRLSDVDGTMTFKNFATVTSHAEANIADQDRLGLLFSILYDKQHRAGLQYALDNQGNRAFTTQAMIKDLEAAGIFKPKKLNPEQHQAVMQTWAKNSEAAFPAMAKEQLKYFTERAVFSANTARAGWIDNCINETINPNHLFGFSTTKDELGVRDKFNPQMQASFLRVLGVDHDPTSKLAYNVDINGMEGSVLKDRQIFHAGNNLDVSYSGLHDILAEAGFYDKVFKNAKGIYPRVGEFKGNYTHYTRGLMEDHLAHKVKQLDAGQDRTTLRELLKNNKLSQAHWKALPVEEKVKKLNLHEVLSNSKPAFANPQAWEMGFEQLLTQALALSEDIAARGSNDYTPVWKLLQQRTRGLNEADHRAYEAPHLELVTYNGVLQTKPHQARLDWVNKAMEEGMTGKAVIPVGSQHRTIIEAALKEGASSKEAVQKLLKEMNTVDYACLTVHSLTSELAGVYEKFGSVAKYAASPASSKEATVLESGKWELLSWILELEHNPKIQAMLKDRGFDSLLRIESNSKALEYNTDKKKAMINMINNSSSYKTFEYYPNVTKEVAKAYGYNMHMDPTASYVESVFGGLKIDKGAVIPPFKLKEVFTHMAGDSTGSDMRAIAWLSSMDPLNTSEVVRGMIDDVNLFNEMVSVLNVGALDGKSMAEELAKSYRKYYKKQGIAEKDSDTLIKTYWQQVYANPFRYKENKDKTVSLVGTGHEAILKAFGKEQNRFTLDEFKAMYKAVHDDINMPSIFHADDVPHKHARDFLSRAFTVGDEDFAHRLLKSPSLAEAALDEIPELKNRHAFSLGMPFTAAWTLDKLQPPVHQTGWNVYHPLNRLLQAIPINMMHFMEAGGALGLVAGAVATTVTVLQLHEHAKHRNLTLWDTDLQPVVNTVTQNVSQASMQGWQPWQKPSHATSATTLTLPYRQADTSTHAAATQSPPLASPSQSQRGRTASLPLASQEGFIHA